ncbi:MAG: SH3 domain-containing protein, partial [Thermomicrobiales bacterium]
DSALLGGNWAKAVFAFGTSAAIPTFGIADTGPDDAGNSIETAVEIGEIVRTGGWDITVTEWIREGAVFDAADYRTRALGSGFAPYFRAVKATITNLNPVPSVFPNDAFLVTDADGEPWDNVLALTAPEPDASREYLPGATREGWAAFDCSAYPDMPAIVYVRAQINSLVGDPRYIIVGTVGETSATSEAESTETTPESGSVDSDPLDIAAGDIVVTINEIVNLRPDASTSGETIAELEPGTELEVTGEPIEAEGYRWYPVRVIDSDDAGFVVQDFIEPV